MVRAVDAGFLRRVAALVLDVALALAAFAFLNLVLYKVGLIHAPAAAAPHPLLVWMQPEALAGVAVVGSLGVIACWRWQQGTPGALMMGANVVRTVDGARAGLMRLLLRFGVSLLLGGVGLLWCLGGRPALHDRLSGTRLVLEDDGLVALSELIVDGGRR